MSIMQMLKDVAKDTSSSSTGSTTKTTGGTTTSGGSTSSTTTTTTANSKTKEEEKKKKRKSFLEVLKEIEEDEAAKKAKTVSPIGVSFQDAFPWKAPTVSQSPKKSESTKQAEEGVANNTGWFRKGLFEDGYDFGDVTKTILGISDKKELKTFEAPETTDSLEVLKQKVDYYKGRKWLTADQQKEMLKATKQYNDMALFQYSDTLSKTKMDGTDHTVLEEIEILANMKSGKEKDERKEKVLAKMEELGMDTAFYPHFAGDGEFDWGTFGSWLGNSAMAGLNMVNSSLLDTADVLPGALLKALGWENNPISEGAEYYHDLYDTYKYNANLNAEKLGGNAWNFGAEAVEGTVGSLPYVLLMIMTSGQSATATTSSLMNNAAMQIGNVLTKAGLTTEAMLKNPQYWMSFARELGPNYKEAKELGASDTAASIGSVLKAIVNSGIEIGTDGRSGIQGLSDGLKNGGKPFWELMESSIVEGGEEDLQKFVGEVINKFGYGSDEEILNPIEYAKEGTIGVISGMALGGGQTAVQSGVNAYADHQANKLTENEQKVVDAVYKKRLAEEQKKGKVDKSKIYDDVIRDMDKGYITTDEIESALGGDTYSLYKNTVDSEDAILKEYEELGKKTNATLAEQSRYAELTQQVKNIREKSQRDALKSQLGEEVFNLVKGDRLVETYNERARRGEAFQADLTKYDAKQQVVIQKAIDSGILNNTNRTHEFVDLISKISADKGVLFDFTNNQKLKDSGFAVDGKQVNGYVTKDGITLNIDSKKALETTVGHEITHVLEGTEFYDTLKQTIVEYSKAKGDYQGRFDTLTELYKDVKDADIEAELTADLVGDYLFSDTDFIKSLSTQNRNVFQKIYDEIKYLCNVVTAGSKEGRELERVRKAFEDAYRADGKAQTETKYSISEIVDQNQKFSLSNVGEEPVRSSYRATLGKDIALDIGPTAEEYAVGAKNAPTQTISKTETVDEAPLSDSGEEVKQTRKQYHQSIIDRIRGTFNANGFDFDKVLKNAKNLSTWSTVDNTPQRVMEKSLGYKAGGILADITVNKVAQNESEGIKWVNENVKLLKDISKQYHIKPGSKESTAAQMYAEGFYVNENNEIIRYGDPELIQDFKNPEVRRNIKGLARDPRIRKIYDDTLASINESRARNLYPEIPRLDNYFLHFRAMTDTFSTLGLPFNPNDIRAKDLPTDLNGVTADLKPGQPYFASAMHREGKRTSFDLLGGVERYLNSAKNQIYHIDDIQTLRALRNYIAETYGQATGLEDIDSMSDAEAEERIKQVYGAHLSTFAKFLNEEANVLAGKTALIDRGIEGIIGRRGITFINTLNQQVGSNMVGYNVSSSLTNFLPVAQTFAKANKFDFVKAFTQTVANKVSGGRLDSFAEDSPVVIRRKGQDRFYQTPWQKMQNPGYALMRMVDDISTELIARTKYNEFVRKGMDSQKAHFETDKWVSRLMGDRSLGQMPQLYNSKMLGLITKFQLEVRNQLDAQFYDTIQEKKVSNEQIQNGLVRNTKTAAQVASTFAQLAVVQHLFGAAFESVAGYNPAFDIIEVLMTAFGYDDEEDSEDTALDNFAQGLLALAEDMPYASTFTGGRVPISEAIPDVNAILRGEDEYGNEIGIPKALVENAKEIAPYYLLPGGFGQAKKTKAGLDMFSDEHPIAGSYTDAGNLRFPVEDTLKNRIHAGVFGQHASENARKYFNQEQRTLNPEQTEIFAELDMPIEEYWEYRDNLYDFYDVKDELKEAAYADGATAEDSLKYKHISSVYNEIYDLYDKQKELASGNSLTKKEQIQKIQEQMSDMLTSSKYEMDNAFITSSYAEVGDRRYNYDAEKDTWYEIKPKNADGTDNLYYQKEQEVTNGLGISYSEYWSNREEYNYAYDKPGRYAIAQTVGGYDAYMEYYDALENWQSDNYIAADKDSKGETISGSRKEKVKAYIEGLDLDYGEKIILYRTVYSSKKDKNAYNMEIVNYLNSRKDLSYADKKSILEELEMVVDDDGYIEW